MKAKVSEIFNTFSEVLLKNQCASPKFILEQFALAGVLAQSDVEIEIPKKFQEQVSSCLKKD